MDNRVDTLWEKVITGNGDISLMVRVSNLETQAEETCSVRRDHVEILRSIQDHIEFQKGKSEEQEKTEARRARNITILLSIIGLMMTFVTLKLQFHW